MQKLMIVEDEKSIFFLLNSCILYDELGLELVGYAENGQMAYDMILEKRPDIVITDITMPIIDGLELIEKVQAQQINSQFIIISGYAQFEFAKKAVTLGVRDYLLKPINSSEVNKSLERLTQKSSKDKEEGRLLQSSDRHREKIRTSFIMSILYRDIDFCEMTLQRINQDYIYSFQEEGGFCALAVKLDYVSDIVVGIKNHITEMLMTTIKDNFIEYCCEIGVIEHQETIYVILNLKKDSNVIEKLKTASERVVASGKRLTEIYSEACVTVCLGTVVSEIRALPESLDMALHLLEMRIVRGVNQMLMPRKSDYRSCMEERKYMLPSRMLQALIERVECNELVEAKAEIAAIFQDILEFCEDNDVSVYKTIRGVILNMLSVIKQKGNFPNEFMDIYYELLVEINKCSCPGDVTELLPDKMLACMLKYQKNEQSEGALIMKRVKGYIAQNYHKQLKLEEVAEQVYITPAYLGIVFKKETGKNFTTYLTDLRMEKAKILLRDIGININEITYKVGYNNVRYFSRTFKEKVGITPKEYRRIHANRTY